MKKAPCKQTISIAVTSHTSQVEGQTSAPARIGDHDYRNVNLLIVKTYASTLLSQILFGRPKQPLSGCNVAEASVPDVLFLQTSVEIAQ